MSVLVDLSGFYSSSAKMAQLQKEKEATSFSGIRIVFHAPINKGKQLLKEAKEIGLEHHILKIDAKSKTVDFMIKSEDLDILEAYLDTVRYQNIVSSDFFEYNSLDRQQTR